MDKLKISAITILYNFDKKIIDNIKSYEKYVDEVILVDNSDSKKYYNKYEKELKNYTYISMDGNKGIAKALNEGMRYAIQKGYNWCITFDQDSFLNNNIIDIYYKYIKKLNDENIIIYSPVYIFDRRKYKKFDGIKELKYVMQSANLVRLENFIRVGMFKEDFFIDMVDYEFCLRARKKGYRIISCGEAEIYHNPGITRKSKIFGIKYGYCSKERIYYQSRNILWTFKKYKDLSILAILMYKLFKILVFFDNKKEFLKYYFKGISDCKNNRFGVLKDNE